MARLPDGGGRCGGVYAWLLARERAALAAPGQSLHWQPDQVAYHGTTERLALLEAGEPVYIEAIDLPPSARPNPCRGPLYVTVTRDYRVEVRSDPEAEMEQWRRL